MWSVAASLALAGVSSGQFAFTKGGAGGTCENGAGVAEPNGVGIVGCHMCINDGGPTDSGLADCRQCCNALAGEVGSPQYNACRLANGC